MLPTNIRQPICDFLLIVNSYCVLGTGFLVLLTYTLCHTGVPHGSVLGDVSFTLPLTYLSAHLRQPSVSTRSNSLRHPGLPVTVRHGSNLSGRRLPVGLRRRSSSAAFCHIEDVRCEANLQQLWRQVFCSCRSDQLSK